MLNFFKTAPLCYALKFRKFAAPILFFACAASAAINVNTSENVEIASFIVSESNKALRVPSGANLDLVFHTARDKHGRAVPVFFWGQREVSISVEYVLSLPNSEQLKGVVKSDTSWLTGYCGMIECRTRPMPILQRLDALKDLVKRALEKLNVKFDAFPEPESSNMAAVADTIAEPVADTVAAPAADTVAEPAQEE